MVRLDENPSVIGEDIADEIVLPPSNLYSDEPPLESDLHRHQIDLLIRLLKAWWHDRQDFYISGNLTVYYNMQQLKSRDFRGPDVFVVLGTEKRDRRSWAIWDEGGKYPNVVIELLSNSTARVDKGAKKTLYQERHRKGDRVCLQDEGAITLTPEIAIIGSSIACRFAGLSGFSGSSLLNLCVG